MPTRTIALSSGEELEVVMEGDRIWLSVAGRWLQSVTREDAWRLAEALDELATATWPDTDD